MSKCVQWMCVLAFSAAALSAQVASPFPTTETTGMVGLANSQTAQLNLLNPGVAPPAMGMVCSAVVTFVGADGNVIKSGAVTVIPGKSASLSLRSDTDLATAVGDRREIRALIAIPAIPPPPTAGATPPAAPCTLIPTLEIYDTFTGRTLVTLGHTVTVK